VFGAPGPYRCQPATLGNSRARSAIIHRTVQCASRATASSRQRSTMPSEQCSTVSRRSQSSKVRGASDCPGPQEDKAPTVDLAQNPNGWVTWRRTRQGTMHVRWRTRLSSAPIATSLPNGYGSGWGYKYPPTTLFISIQAFQTSHSIQEQNTPLQDTSNRLNPL
jgi:hypothetical protein